jgi:hypothetical protein
MSNSLLFRPNTKFGGQNIAASDVRYLQKFSLLLPTQLGVETAGEQNRIKIHGRNPVSLFYVCQTHRHLSIHFLPSKKSCSI